MHSLLVELQRLKNLDRTGWTLRGLPPGTESVASHSFGVSVAAMLLADELAARGLSIDSERMMRMALLHDWAETRVGDLPRTATHYFGPELRKNAERAAFADIVRESGSGASNYEELFEDYEQRASLEARLVKAADVIDLLVQVLALETAGVRGLDEFWEVAHQADFQLDGAARQLVAETIRDLWAARAKLKPI